MFRKAFIPLTKPVPAAATVRTLGSPTSRPFGPPVLYPAVPCLPSTPAKTAARSTEMKVKNAERVASLDRVSKVLGREHTQESTAQIAENPTVQTAPLLMVFRYFAPVKTWSP